jgi:hypothetical protein
MLCYVMLLIYFVFFRTVLLGENTFSIFSIPLVHTDQDQPLTSSRQYLDASTQTPLPSAFTVDGFFKRLSYKPKEYPFISLHAKITKSKKPGFFFWSTVINPFENSVIIWDTTSGNLQCRHMSNLTINW